MGVAKGLKVPCLFVITEVSIRCQKTPEVGIRRIPAYTPQYTTAFSALTLLVGRQEGHPACKKQWWGAGMVICLEQGQDLHTAQLMPLPGVCLKVEVKFSHTRY